MKKKFLAIILCLFCFVLCGCSNDPQYTISQDATGVVNQIIYIPFSVQELYEYGIDFDKASQMGQTLKESFDERFKNQYDNFITRLSLDKTLTDEEKKIILNSCPTKEQMSGESSIFDSSSSAGIIYNFKFQNAISYYYFNNVITYEELVKELEKDDSVIEKGFLTIKKTNTNPSVFGFTGEFSQTATLAQYITESCIEVLTNEGTLSQEQIMQVVPTNYVYRFGTTQKRLHSDADEVRYIGGIYYHEWNIDVQNSTREISTWYVYANQKVWYGIALVLTLILLSCFIIRLKNEEKNKNSNQIEIVEP